MHRLETPDSDPHQRLRERMCELEVLAWRLSAEGRVMTPPPAKGVLATWLCNQCLVGLLEAAGGAAAARGEVSRATVMPGCEALFLPVRSRRRVTEWTVGMFLTPGVLDAREFTEGCRRVHIDAVAAAKAIRPIATFGEAEIGRLCRLLPRIAEDLGQIDRDQAALSGFSQTLGEAYEHIELTHRLAGQMRHLGGPREFLRDAIEGVLHATGFGWVAIYTDRKPWAAGSDRPMFLTAGDCPAKVSGVRTLLDDGLFDPDAGDESVITSDRRVERLVGQPDQLVAFPIQRGDRVVGVLLAGDKRGDDPQVSTYDTRVIDTVGSFARSYYEIVCLLHEQQEMFLGSLRAITAALDAKDSYTRGHSERVAHLAAELARKAGLGEDEVERVHIAGLMHDVGKIGVAESVLRKAGKLTDEEFAEIKRHPRIGHEILSGIPMLQDVLPGVLWHHERWDGRGYPDGLTGGNTPKIARILAIADSFDAMSSNRSYRPAMARDQVLAEIARVGGSQLDPDLAKLFVTLDLTEYDRMVARHTPQAKHGEQRAA
ncbi:MAG: HD-GYP domain-containing protein [Phycisphaerales bacterium]|nr:HD-GYP domain-containing protein [Phycisphaerales bacterium]